MKLEDSIRKIKGIGEKTALPFAKAGIHTIGDLLAYYPRAYETFSEPVTLDQTEDGGKYAVQGILRSVSAVKR